ncbi:hypothetical protein Hypma_016506 [Hypsizygus marmoreus]|uniref:Uncharacterized protein n=1 Tax=Hypsizygus marmoreus TaxID=39966 RepID=A0A369IZQ0_HYPMA|nr:hypothetical protein Hypma_016506 [Hypsizygus marmoreus]
MIQAKDYSSNQRWRDLKTRLRDFIYAEKSVRKLGLHKWLQENSVLDARPSLQEPADSVPQKNNSQTARARPASSKPHVTSLPPEILGEIFIHTLPSEAYPFPEVDVSPMLLCQVCRYWKLTALSLARLWSSFTCHVGIDTRCSHIELFKLWLDRSRQHPLALSFRPAQGSRPMMEVLLANAHRWRAIRSQLDSELGSLFMGIRGEDVLLLETISIMIMPGNWDTDQVISTLTSFPSLRQLEWLKSISVDQLITLLSHCPLVEYVVAHPISTSAHSTNTQRPIIVTHLRFLSFHNWNSEQILDRLVLPSLRSLELLAFSDPEALRRLDDRSSCKLEAFDILCCGASEALVYLQLPCMQTLRSLTLRSDAINDDVVALLTWIPGSHTTVLPRLMDIALNVSMPTDGNVGKMVTSRWRRILGTASRPTPLQCVDLSYEVGRKAIRDRGLSGLEYHTLDFSCIEQLSRDGLDISIVTVIGPFQWPAHDSSVHTIFIYS